MNMKKVLAGSLAAVMVLLTPSLPVRTHADTMMLELAILQQAHETEHTHPAGEDGTSALSVAAEATVLDSGTCGEHLTWTLTEDGTLTISGTGAMTDYEYDGIRPWSVETVRTIVVGDGITTIGNYAFKNCTGLTAVDLPSTLTRIGHSAFETCTGLAAITVPSGTKSIGASAFYGCNALTSITLPDSVTTIDAWAFCGCSILSEITIPSGVTVLANNLFDSCDNLRRVHLPSGLTKIGYSAFEDCGSLSEIVIPSGVTSIGSAAFIDCESLTSIVIPSGVKTLGDMTFKGCTGLTKITLPAGLATIGATVFKGCENLTSIVIPSGVTSIGKNVFESCKKLKTICFTGNAPTINARTFYRVVATVQYPMGNVTWTEDVKQNYGGTLTWEAVCTIHNYVQAVTSPTCMAPGYTTYTCSTCGDSYTSNETVMLGHDMGAWSIVSVPTCTEAGIAVRVCSRCDHTETRTLAAAGHSYVPTLVLPTCTTPGYNSHTCTACGHNYVDTETAALGHAMGEWKIYAVPDCTTDGEMKRTCIRCDYSETDVLGASGHKYTYTVTKDPTERATGMLLGVCERCSVATPVELPALNPSDYICQTLTAATCTTNGVMRYTWKNTGYGLYHFYTATPMLGHNYKDGTCTICGAEDPDYIAIIDSGWSGNTQWTLNEQGVLTFTGNGNMKNYGFGKNQP